MIPFPFFEHRVHQQYPSSVNIHHYSTANLNDKSKGFRIYIRVELLLESYYKRVNILDGDKRFSHQSPWTVWDMISPKMVFYQQTHTPKEKQQDLNRLQYNILK